MSIARVTDLHYVAYAVPDLAAEREFFTTTWGLTEVGEEDGKVYFAAEGSPHPFVIRLREDAEKKTDLIGYSAESRADVDTLFEQAKAAGAQIISAPGPAEGPQGGYSFRCFDIDGHALEIICDTNRRMHRTLNRMEAIPVGLSHIVLHSPDHRRLQAFYEQAFGFRMSDWIGDFMVFLRCNPAHHRLAIMPGPAALNHVAFDVSTVDDLMRGLARLMQAGVKLQWGPGRHTAGNNTFSYYITPNGNAVEYTSDLEDVDEETWEPRTYPMGPDVTDQWGTGRLLTANAPHQAMDTDKGLWQVPA